MPDEQNKKRILVVDDNEGMRRLLVTILPHYGEYEVVVALDGQDALNKLRQQPADLVISDVDMPIMDGLKLLITLRQDTALAHIPVIIMSGEDYERRAQVASSYNAQFIRKPLELDQILQAVKQALAPAT
ncbi:MAG: response regulator [Candidatus Sungbacteria bacterium]|nr:response regulator [Candidatus Sungbacteria bacterium]